MDRNDCHPGGTSLQAMRNNKEFLLLAYLWLDSWHVRITILEAQPPLQGTRRLLELQVVGSAIQALIHPKNSDRYLEEEIPCMPN